MWISSKRQDLSSWKPDPDAGSSFSPSVLQGVSPWSTRSLPSSFNEQSVCRVVSHWAGGPKLPNLFKTKPPTLTDPLSGLFRQKVDRNLSELAVFLLSNYNFANIEGRLALYRHPCWELIPPKHVLRVLNSLLDGEEAINFLSSQQVDEIATRILASPRIPAYKEMPSPDYHVICCQDALYDWEREKIIPATSQAMRFSCLAVEAQDIAPAETPYFDCFVNGVDGSGAFRQLVLEVIGVVATGFPCKNFFVLEGPPDSGKSQLARFLKGLLGDRSCFALNDIGQLGDRWTTGQLPGKLLCLCSDAPNKPLGPKAVGTIKQLTGDDPIHGEEKYQTPFVFQNTAKLVFSTNFPLRISGELQDNAFEHRMVVVPFSNSVPTSQQIPHLADYLLEEAGGILWMALQAVRELEARNGEFTTVDTIDKARHKTPETVAPLDKLTAFVNECCIFEPEAVTSVGDLYERFRCFEGDRFPCTLSITRAVFGKLFRRLALPITEERAANRRCFRGVRLCDSSDHTLFPWEADSNAV